MNIAAAPNHWIIAPVLIPLLAGALLLSMSHASVWLRRCVGLTVTLCLLGVSVWLVYAAQQGAVLVYALGDWSAPFGIVLVLDRLSAALLVLTSLVAFCSLLYASCGEDEQGAHFHALFQFQLLGLNGAFLTGDLFNLFVFFEILLIASYTLLMHGHGRERSRASVHVVSLNIVGSALFLFAVGTLYSVTGTLNIADLTRLMPTLEDDAAVIARTGGLLLLVVLALKAALLPLSFWLPKAYASAAASVAALFALMTKVGVYAIVRIYTSIFGGEADLLANVAEPWLLPAALLTLMLGVFGMLAARSLRAVIAWLVIVSVGTLLTTVGLFTEGGLVAGTYYLLHSTLVTAALFLLADVIAQQRGALGDDLNDNAMVAQPALLGTLFFIAVATMIGLPPFSGFIGKLLILQAAYAADLAVLIWSVVLTGSVLSLMFMTRVGSTLFWKTGAKAAAGMPVRRRAIAAIVMLLGGNVSLVAFGGSAGEYALATARQLSMPQDYQHTVLHAEPELRHHRRSLQ